MSSACWMTRSRSFSWVMEAHRDRFPWSSPQSSGTLRVNRQGQSRAAQRASCMAEETHLPSVSNEGWKRHRAIVTKVWHVTCRCVHSARRFEVFLLCPFCHSDLLINPPGGHELRKRSCRSCVDAGRPKATHFFSHALCHFYTSLFPAQLQDLSTKHNGFSGHSYFIFVWKYTSLWEYVYRYVRATSAVLISSIKVRLVSQLVHF